MDAYLMLMAGLLAGAAATWLYCRSERSVLAERLQTRESQIEELEAQGKENKSWIAALEKEGASLKVTETELKTRLEQERQSAQEKIAVLDEARQKLADAFKGLSAEALRSNNETFLQLAREVLEKHHSQAGSDLEGRQKAIGELVKPLAESIEKMDLQLREIEGARQKAYGELAQHVTSMAAAETQLRSETANLVTALRSPKSRGRWGEMQLGRVLDAADLVKGRDYEEQITAPSDNGNLRPDVIVRLPEGRNVVVDAKTPLQAYLEALEAQDELARREKMGEHARQVRAHIEALAAKGYWERFRPTPEFVVMFLPGEAFFSAALEHDPGLIEFGASKRVILATPTTLLALLRGVAYGWRQHRLAENASAISDTGRELYERLRTMGQYFEDLRRGLDRAVESYNRVVGSVESRVLVSARRLKDLGAGSSEDIDLLMPVDRSPRLLQAPEFEPTEEMLTRA